MIYTARQFEYYFSEPRTLRSNQTPPRRTSAPQTSAHAPLFVNPFVPPPAYVRPSLTRSWLQNIKLTCVRCHGTSWLHTTVVGRCVIYTASGPSALGCVNHAAPYTSVCNPYISGFPSRNVVMHRSPTL